MDLDWFAHLAHLVIFQWYFNDIPRSSPRFPGQAAQEHAAALHKEMDKDGDGQVSVDELTLGSVISHDRKIKKDPWKQQMQQGTSFSMFQLNKSWSPSKLQPCDISHVSLQSWWLDLEIGVWQIWQTFLPPRPRRAYLKNKAAAAHAAIDKDGDGKITFDEAMRGSMWRRSFRVLSEFLR